MTEQPINARPARRILAPAVALTVVLVACSVYANLSSAVTDRDGYAWFPPFEPGNNANHNDHLGAEYFNIATAMRAGEGFASPFREPTGPTAWMPPVLPTVLAGLLWLTGDDEVVVMTVVIFLQVYVLIMTGFLVLALTRATAGRLGAWTAAVVFALGVVCDFHQWFQMTHDCWLVLLAVNLLIAGLCWCRPLDGRRAAAWGLFGGLCALASPIVGFCWGALTSADALGRRTWKPLALALLAAGLTLTPWTVRNYVVFGRLIPVKSNAAYELYQSQCLQP